MNSFGVDVCEICGTHAADHQGWFAVAGSGANLEVLPWTDDVRGRSDCHHACCSEHLERLVFSAATHDLGALPLVLEPWRGGWNPEALQPASAPEEQPIADESLLQILSMVDSILATSSDEEDDGAPAFDA